MDCAGFDNKVYTAAETQLLLKDIKARNLTMLMIRQ